MVDRGEMAAGSSACGCGAQHAAHGEGSARSGWVGALLAVLACALCPACLTTYAKLLSVLGMGVGLDAAAHERLLPAALVASIAISGWRSWRTRRAWPLLAAVLGSSLVALAHGVDELHALEWLGMLVLVAGAVAEHRRFVASPGSAGRPWLIARAVRVLRR